MAIDIFVIRSFGSVVVDDAAAMTRKPPLPFIQFYIINKYPR